MPLSSIIQDTITTSTTIRKHSWRVVVLKCLFHFMETATTKTSSFFPFRKVPFFKGAKNYTY
jgi:hypothetical protein